MIDPTKVSPRTAISPEWEVRKGNKIYPIETNELLASLWQSDRLKPTDYLRRRGELDWRKADSINWPAFVAAFGPKTLVPERSTDSTTDEVSSEGVETAEVAVDAATLLEEAKQEAMQAAEANQPQERPAWWNEDKSDRSRHSKTRRQLTSVLALATTTIVLVVVGMVILLSNFRKPTDTTPLQPQTAAAHTQSLPESPSAERDADESANTINNNTANNNAAHNSANIINEADTSSPLASMPEPTNTTGADSATLDAIPDITPDPDRAIQRPSQPTELSKDTAKDTANPALDATAQSQLATPEPAALTASQDEQPVDGEVARLVNEAKASIKFYRGTRAQIEAIRKTIGEASSLMQKAQQTVGEATAYIPQLNSTIRQVQLELPRLRLQANLTGAGNEARAVSQQAEAELNNAIKLIQEAQSKLDAIGLTTANCRQQIQAQQLRIQQAVNDLQGVVRHELASLDKYMEVIDFFGEKPIEFHRQVFEETTQNLIEEPDLFYALLLNSASAVRLERFDVPGKNLNQLQVQANAIASDERAHRQVALRRFAALAQALAGVSHWRQQRLDMSLKLLEDSVKAEPKMAELHLLRGVVGTFTRGVKDGTSHFKAAAILAPNDARVHRIRLETLLKTSTPSPQLLRAVLADLLKVAVSEDQRSRLAAAEARLALQEYDLARLYVEKVTAPELKERKARLLQALDQPANQDLDTILAQPINQAQ